MATNKSWCQFLEIPYFLGMGERRGNGKCDNTFMQPKTGGDIGPKEAKI